MTKCETMARNIKNDTNQLIIKATSCINIRLDTLKERSEPLMTKIREMHDIYTDLLSANTACLKDYYTFVAKMACIAAVSNEIKKLHLLIILDTRLYEYSCELYIFFLLEQS